MSVPRSPGRVINIAPSAAARRRARRELQEVVLEAQGALAGVQAGDLELIYTAHWAISRAVGVVMRHGLDVEVA